MSKAFIVLVNYTKYQDTIECLESVLKSNYQDFQIILIDNSPDDESEINISNWLNGVYDNTQIKTLFPELVYPLQDKPISYTYFKEEQFAEVQQAGNEKILFVRAVNRGFAAANNVALKYVLKQQDNSAFVWLLNNDTVIEKNTLANLVGFYKENLPLYIIGSKLKFYHNKHTLQAVCGRYNKWLGSTYHIGEGEIDNGQYDNYVMTKDNYIVGASMFLPYNFLNATGLMNEDYFLYYEEMDWILSGYQYGFKIALQQNAIVYHKEGASIEGLSSNGKDRNKSVADYYSIVNRLKFTKRWYPYCTFSVSLGIIYALLKRLIKGRFKFVGKVSKVVVKVLLTSQVPTRYS
jgi:GT2 family glycosyltransferase